MSTTIRIGTRDSELALWQATTVEKQLNDLGYKTQIIAVKSDGDIVLDKPLYELGITGIFTKTLDVAMIQGTIDIAVHSMKDVPTLLPNGIVQGAVLERASSLDIMVHKGNLDFLTQEKSTIATSSLRRKASWLHKYPTHTIEDIRGNVNTRLQKVATSDWSGAIFAEAGLERINLKPDHFIALDWMVPAPAQGAMVVVCNADDLFSLDAVSQLNHIETEICTYIERQFLRTLEGGCTAPIGAIASYNEKEDIIDFTGVLLSIDGKQKIEVKKVVEVSEWKKLGFSAAHEILTNGGATLMAEIKKQLEK
ncbi:MAG: Hydroxymethylbilane synthase [Bacteroidota bacterium]